MKSPFKIESIGTPIGFGPEVPPEVTQTCNAMLPELNKRLQAILDTFPNTPLGARSASLATTLHSLKQIICLLDGPDEAKAKLSENIVDLVKLVRGIDTVLVMRNVDEMIRLTDEFNERMNAEIRLLNEPVSPLVKAAIEKARQV